MKEKSNKSLMTERVFKNTVRYLLFEAKIHKELDTFFNSKKTKKVIVDVNGTPVQYFLQPNIENFLRSKFSEPGTKLVGMDLAWIRKEIKSQAEVGGVEPLEDWINYIEMMRSQEIKEKLTRTDLNEYIDLNDLRSTVDAVAQLSEDQQAVFEDIMKDSRHIQMIAEFDDHEIYFPITVQGSIAFDTPRKTTWCTTKPRGQNLFYSYVARGQDVVLYYVLKKSLKDTSEAPSKVCLGFINKKLKLPSRSGSETVDLPNNGLTEDKLRSDAYLGDDYDAIVATCQSHIASLKDGHPARKVIRRCCASIEYLKAQIKDYGKDEKRDFVDLVKRAEYYKSPPVLEYCFFYGADGAGVDRNAFIKNATDYLSYDAGNGYFPKFLVGTKPRVINISNLTQKGIDTLDLSLFDLSGLERISFHQHGDVPVKVGNVQIEDRHMKPLLDLVKSQSNLERTRNISSRFKNIDMNITKTPNEDESYQFRAPELLRAISEAYSDKKIYAAKRVVEDGGDVYTADNEFSPFGVNISAHNLDSHEGLSAEMLTQANDDYRYTPNHNKMYRVERKFDRIAETDASKYLEQIKKIADSIGSEGGTGISINITTCDIDSVPDITQLGEAVESLYIYNCKNITSIPKFSGVNRSLTNLTISACSLSDSESLMNIKNAFPNLVYIDISKNPLERLPETCFYNQETEANTKYDIDQLAGQGRPFSTYARSSVVGSIFRLDISCTKIEELPRYIFYNERTGESLISNNEDFTQGRVGKSFYADGGLDFNSTKLKTLTKDIASAESKKIVRKGDLFMNPNYFSFSEFEEKVKSNRIEISQRQLDNMGGIENFFKSFQMAKEVKYDVSDFNTWGKSNIFTLDGRKNPPPDDEYGENENLDVWNHEEGDFLEVKHVPLSDSTIKSMENLFIRAYEGDKNAHQSIVSFLDGGVERINLMNLRDVSSNFLSILMRYLIDYCGSFISSVRIGSVKSSYGISGIIDAMNNCSVPIYSITITGANNDSAIDNIDTDGTLSIDLNSNNISEFPIKTFERYLRKNINLGSVKTGQWNVGRFFDISNNPISQIPSGFLSILLKYGYSGQTSKKEVVYTNIRRTNIDEIEVVKKVLIPIYIAYVKNILKPEQYFYLTKPSDSENAAFNGYDDNAEAEIYMDTDDWSYFLGQILNIKDYMIQECNAVDAYEKKLALQGEELDKEDIDAAKNVIDTIYDNIRTNAISDEFYCVFHKSAVLVEIHEAYKRNGYTSDIYYLKDELDGIAGYVSDDEVPISKKEIEDAQKEKIVNKENLINFFAFLDSFGEDYEQDKGSYLRYMNAYNAIYAENNIGTSVGQMLIIVNHVINKEIYVLNLIRQISMLNINSVGVNKNWSNRQISNIIDDYSEEGMKLIGINQSEVLNSGEIPSYMKLCHPNNFEPTLEVPLTDCWPTQTFSGYIDNVVGMINRAQKIMSMLRSSTRTGYYSQHIDSILQNGAKDGVSVNNSMCYVMADINIKIDPDKINLSYALDNEGSLHNIFEDTYLNLGFRADSISTSFLQPFDPSNYLFYISVPDDKGMSYTIDLVKFLEDSTGEKYGIMHTGGKGIQENPFGVDIGPNDFIF